MRPFDLFVDYSVETFDRLAQELSISNFVVERYGWKDCFFFVSHKMSGF